MVGAVRLWRHWSNYTAVTIIDNYKFGSMTVEVKVEGRWKTRSLEEKGQGINGQV